MTVSALAVQLTLREKAAAPNAYSWAWRILSEYPESLRLAAEAWAEEKELPEVSITEITLEQVLRRTGSSVPQALELLYVISKDPSEGRNLLARCTRRDSLR